MFDFQKLLVYQKAKSFHLSCKELLTQYRLDSCVKDQLGRASFSVVLNIAEGSGKFSKRDRRNYFTTARASIFECVAILDILSDQGGIAQEKKDALYHLADELSKILFSMVRNLNKAEWKTQSKRSFLFHSRFVSRAFLVELTGLRLRHSKSNIQFL